MQAFTYEVFTIVRPALEAVLVAVLIALAHKGLKRLNLSLDEKGDAQLKYYAEQAAKWVEEMAAAQFKNGGEKLTGPQKLQLATAAVVQSLNVEHDKAKFAVQAALPDLPGIGAVGK